MGKYQRSNGITLIALVITIIIMLILAGLVISIVLNGGTFDQANTAGEETRGTTVQQESDMWKREVETILELGGNPTSAKDKIEELNGRGLLTDKEKEELLPDGTYNDGAIKIGSKDIDFIIKEKKDPIAEGEIIPIYTRADLQAVASEEYHYCATEDETYYMAKDGYYEIKNDISAGIFYPIQVLEGTLDGNEHTISNLSIETRYAKFSYYEDGYKYTYYTYMAALVGQNMGTIKNLNIENANINVTVDSKSDCYVAGVAGVNDGIISRCSATGEIYARWSYYADIGGISGVNTGIIHGCYSEVNITAYESDVGGITGHNRGQIQNCYNTGNIIGYYVGGITKNNGEGAKIEDCFNIGNINSKYSAGGIAAYTGGTIENCYNIGDIIQEYEYSNEYPGGIISYYDSEDFSIQNCYWYRGINSSASAGIGTIWNETDKQFVKKLSRTEIVTRNKFQGFDFTTTWAFENDADEPPYLRTLKKPEFNLPNENPNPEEWNWGEGE